MPFIEASYKYYKQESEAFLAENPVSEYLKKAEERLKEEKDRVERYLHPTTRERLLTKCKRALIREHAQLSKVRISLVCFLFISSLRLDHRIIKTKK